MTDADGRQLRQRLAALDSGPSRPDAEARQLLRQLRARVLEEAGARLGRVVDDDEREERVRLLVDEIIETDGVRVSPTERRTVIRQIISDTIGYGPLDELMQDPEITEIMCNGPEAVYVERRGVIELTDLHFGDDAHLRAVINRIARAAGRRVDEGSPMVDARMSDGSRMNAILPPLALNGPVLTIRRFPEQRLTPDTLIELGTYSPDLVAVLEACVRGRLNIVVSGGTSTGKTTALNVLSLYIGRHERVITIEDSAELTLSQPHVVSLEARPANTEGEGRVTIRDLLRNALRMRPDRLIIGECRGPEALDMLQGMNSGHEGSMTTVHANTPRDALRRLETMVLMAGYDLPLRAIREQMSGIIHLVLQLERTPDGRRIVRTLSEVQHMEHDTVLMQDLFVYDPDLRRPVRTGLRPSFVGDLAQRGVRYPDPPPSTTAGGAAGGAERSAMTVVAIVLLVAGAGVVAAVAVGELRRRRRLAAYFAGEALADPRWDLGAELGRLRPDAGRITALVVGVVVGGALWLGTGSWFLGIVGVVSAVAVGELSRGRRERARRAALNAQMADGLTSIAASMAAGTSFLQGVHELARNARAPLAPLLEQALAEMDLGAAPSEAFTNLAQRADLPVAARLAHVLRLQELNGSPLVPMLERLAAVVQQSDELAREVMTLTAEGRMSAYVIAALPVVLVVMLEAVQPGYLDPFFEGWWLLVVAGMVASILLGLALISAMVRSLEVDR